MPLIKAPSTKPQYPGKFQPTTSKGGPDGLELGYWSFPGIWGLEFGIFVTASAVVWISSQTLQRCCSVVSTLPSPIRMAVRPCNLLVVLDCSRRRFVQLKLIAHFLEARSECFNLLLLFRNQCLLPL